jgi:hypothetical protein
MRREAVIALDSRSRRDPQGFRSASSLRVIENF